MNFYTKSELFSKEVQLRESEHKAIAAIEKLKTDLFNFAPNTEIKYNAYLSDSGHYYDVVPYLFFNKNVKLSSNFKGKYTLFDIRFWGFPNVNRHKKVEIENKFKVPNAIGTFSENKIKDWLVYWDCVIAELQKEDLKKEAEINEFLESLKDLPVKWHTENKAGYVRQKGLIFEFTIHEGYIDKQIKLDFSGGHTVETFKKLSDNNYLVKG